MQQLTLTRTVRCHWWLVVLTLVLGVASSAYFTTRQQPVYGASATLVLVPSEKAGSPDEIARVLSALERRSIVATYARILASARLRDQVQAQLGLSSSEMRAYKARTSVLPDTNVLQVSVEGPDPRRVADVAGAIALQAPKYAREFYDGVFSLRPLDQPSDPSQPLRPELLRNLTQGALLGLFGGLGLALLAEYWRHARDRVAQQRAPEAEGKPYVAEKM